MRKLPAAAQEERRRQVIGLRQRGMTYEPPTYGYRRWMRRSAQSST